MSAKKQQNIDPMRIAWLLRADLRRGCSAGTPISDWFKMWWLIHGSREYPEWTDYSTLRESGLFRPYSHCHGYKGFGMTPALRFLLDTRDDLTSKFDVETDEGLCDAIAWFFVHGLREYRLVPALDRTTLEALDASPSFLVQNETANSELPSLTWLMFFVWKNSSDLQNKFDLCRKMDRDQYLIWFLFNGVPQLNLAALLTPRWHEWLLQPVMSSLGKAPVARAAYLLWKQHQQLQLAFDLKTNAGINALAMWSEEVWRTQAELSWISSVTTPAEMESPSVIERPFGVNLIGFAFGELGIGEDVRMAAEACETAGIPFAVVNIQPGHTLRQADKVLAAYVEKAQSQPDDAPYAVNIFCLTAFDTARVFLERRKLFEGRYNIGWWPWELPTWPQNWNIVFSLVDEVWAATTFTHQMYVQTAARALAAPPTVTLAPMAVSVKRIQAVKRADFGLREDHFLFLYVFDFNSYLTRKNPFAVLKAFQNAFEGSNDSVGLVLKTMNSDPLSQKWKHFIQESEKDPRVIVLDTTLSRGEVLGLINICDAYVSLHRSEGFGRTLAEAMAFGKPVIGTNFSGNVDFLSHSNGYPVKWKFRRVKAGEYPFITPLDNAWWADPDISDAALQMRTVFHENQNKIASKNYVNAVAQYNPMEIGKKMLTRLLYIHSKLPTTGRL